MVTCTTPWLSGASLENTSFARSMIAPSAYGPRSSTVHVAVAPDALVIVTTVPIGNVRWAHVPGGAASYQVAGPLWVRPWGAVPAPGDVDVGAGLDGGADNLDAGFTAAVARRAVGGGAVLRNARGVNVAWAMVVGCGEGTVVFGAAACSTTGAGRSGAEADTVRAPLSTWGGEDDGGAPRCTSASAGPPAIAAHRATGTARRAFLKPRVVRTPPLGQNAGAACPLPHVLKPTQRRFGIVGEPTRGFLWIANPAKRTAGKG